MSDNAPTLKELAEDINASFDAADRQDIPLRVEIGNKLLQAKKAVEAIKVVPWEAWCEQHINRSLGDIRKVIALAQAEDPFLAAQQEREKNRQRIIEARRRAKEPKSHVAAQPTDTPEDRAHVCATALHTLMAKVKDIEVLRAAWTCASPETRTLFRRWMDTPEAEELFESSIPG